MMEEAAAAPRALGWRVRLRLLPWPVQLFVAGLIGASLLPPLAFSFAQVAPRGPSVLVAAGRSPVLLVACSLLASFAGLLALELPRSASVRGYAAQLGLRLSSTLSHYDAALQRHLQEESRDVEESR
jgi:hypothetical protein